VSSKTTIELCWQYGHLTILFFCEATALQARFILNRISAFGSETLMLFLIPTPPMDHGIRGMDDLQDDRAASDE